MYFFILKKLSSLRKAARTLCVSSQHSRASVLPSLPWGHRSWAQPPPPPLNSYKLSTVSSTFSCLCLTFSVQFSCSVLCDPMDCSMPGFPITNSLSLLKLMSIELVMPSNYLILCHPLLLLPSIFPSIRVFSNESVLRIRWPKY